MAEPEEPEPTEVEVLLNEFTEKVKTTDTIDYSIVEKCSPENRKELRGLCNIWLLKWRADAEERKKATTPN